MVDDMRVYIANLGKYNEGYLVGDWFSFPIDEEEVAERIGLGVWNDVSLVRSRLEAWRELWREVLLRVQETKNVLLLPEETGAISP